MKRKLFHPTAQALHCALITLCVSFGVSRSVSAALGLAVSARWTFLCCLALTLLFLFFDCLGRLQALVFPALLALVAATAARYAAQIDSIAAAFTLMANGQFLALAAYSRPVAWLICVFAAGLASVIAGSDDALAFTVSLALFILWLAHTAGGEGPVIAASLCLAVLLCCRVRGVSPLRILACSAAVLLLCAPMIALSGTVVPELASLSSRVRQAIDDYFFFDDPRTTFSLLSAGWQPLGPDRLGGPVAPGDEPVMQVAASDDALLRGTVKDHYTGSAWESTAAGRRYLLVSPRSASYRRNLFDANRPSRALREQYLAFEPFTVLMRADAASTLYLTQRFSSLSGSGIVPYYSPAGEVFATHDLAAGDEYAFSGSRFTAHSKGAREAVLAAWDEDDPHAQELSAYLLLPDGVEAGVYDLVGQITQGEETGFDRAIAISRYLKSAYAYTYDQSVPPVGRDFVSWFLLSEQKGYCTSFASAMAVMARIAGLPSRYVEGYAVHPDADGVARVTQRNAHAWTEIYFNGFGWLSFDATPGAYEADSSAGDGSSIGDDLEPPPQGGDSPSPQPTQMPTPSPTPTPTPTPSPTPSPTPHHDDPAVTPTPKLTPEPTPVQTPEPSPTPPPEDPDDGAKTPPWLPLLLLLAAALAALRLWLASPAHLVKGRSAADALYVWYRAVSDLLTCMGLPALPGEAPAVYLSRAQAQLGVSFLAPLAHMLYASRYGRRKLKPAHAGRAERIYRQLLRKATLSQRLRLYGTRFTRGARL